MVDFNTSLPIWACIKPSPLKHDHLALVFVMQLHNTCKFPIEINVCTFVTTWDMDIVVLRTQLVISYSHQKVNAFNMATREQFSANQSERQVI
ncbi:hypothetical protein ACFX13_044419 [Malus domestica]